MGKTIRVHGVAINPEYPFKNKAGVIASGVFSSLSIDKQTEAVEELCTVLGYKVQKPRPIELQVENDEKELSL